MQAIIRSTALLGGSSIIGILVGLVSTKAWAIMLGSSGVAYMGLVQSLLVVAGMVASMGIGTGIVRMGANALDREDYVHVAALRQAGWVLILALAAIEAVLLVLFRQPVSRVMFGSNAHTVSVMIVAAALMFAQVSTFQVSLLNTYHRVPALAKLSVMNVTLSTAAGLVLVYLYGIDGVAPSVLAGSIILWLLAHRSYRREIGPSPIVASVKETMSAASSLLRFGGPFTASMVVGMGMQFLLPVLILHVLGVESVGLHRAAMAISVTYLGFLLTAMTQDYYPRVSAASDRPDELVEIVNQQHRLVMLLAAPMILGVLAVAPYLVRIIYTAEFAPATSILQWQLIGDLFKFSSWTMGFVVLSRSRTITFFAVEAIAGINIVLFSWLGMHLFGLSGLGAAFALTYVVHYLVVLAVVRKGIGLVWSLDNLLMFGGAVGAALLIVLLPRMGLGSVQAPLAALLALVAGVLSFRVIFRELGGRDAVRQIMASRLARVRSGQGAS